MKKYKQFYFLQHLHYEFYSKYVVPFDRRFLSKVHSKYHTDIKINPKIIKGEDTIILYDRLYVLHEIEYRAKEILYEYSD